jgi:HAMP domain-containing protein
MLSGYALDNAKAEAITISQDPEAQRGFATGNFGLVVNVFRRHEASLQGGFAMAIMDDEAEAGFHLPESWPLLREHIGVRQGNLLPLPKTFSLNGEDYMLADAMVGGRGGWVMVGMPLPAAFTRTMQQIEASQKRYLELAQQRKLVRRTYMGLLLLLTVLVLFASTWLALFLSKFVTRPVSALAEATKEISRGRLDYRVAVQSLIAWRRNWKRRGGRSKRPATSLPRPTLPWSSAGGTWKPSWRASPPACCRWTLSEGSRTPTTPCTASSGRRQAEGRRSSPPAPAWMSSSPAT